MTKHGWKSRQMCSVVFATFVLVPQLRSRYDTDADGLVEVENGNEIEEMLTTQLLSAKSTMETRKKNGNENGRRRRSVLNPVGGETAIPVEIFGYNQINGPVFQVPYDNASLMEVPKVLWAGHLRFPGGTVANYWDLAQGTYLPQNCGQGSGNDHGVRVCYTSSKQTIDAMPGRPFTPKKFLEGFGSASPVRGNTGPAYDLNVLTLEGENIRSQLNHLRWVQTQTSVPVRWIEFGNEFFISSFYEDYFPNASVYIERIRDGVAYARQLFPNAKLAVPMGYPFCRRDCASRDSWNSILQANEELFDAITIHDYTACTSSIDGNNYASFEQRTSALLAWGEAAISNQQTCAARFFQGKEIWMTEWNYATFVNSGNGLPFRDDAGYSLERVAQMGTSAIFRASYLLSMLTNSGSGTTNPYTAGHMQHLNELDGSGHGRNAGATKIINGVANIGGVGQVVSHISYIALNRSTSFRLVRVEWSSVLGFALNPAESPVTGLKCIFAVHFNTNDAPITVAINRCPSEKQANIQTIHWQTWQLRTCTYLASADGEWVPVTETNRIPPGYAHPWPEGPLRPDVNTQDVTPDWTEVTLPPFSLTVIDLLSPR